MPPKETDQHLRTCPRCQAWYADVQQLRRRLSVRAAPAVPDLTQVILDRVPAPSGERWPVRIALGLVAIAQSALSVAQFFGLASGMSGMAQGEMAGHLTHETVAWNLAIGVGLLWAALRPKAAAGQLPVLTGFVLVLTALSVSDIVGHAVTSGRLLSHGFVLLGLILLFVLRHQHSGDGRPVTSDGLLARSRAGIGRTEPDVTVEHERPARDRHKPAGHHRAA